MSPAHSSMPAGWQLDGAHATARLCLQTVDGDIVQHKVGGAASDDQLACGHASCGALARAGRGTV